jgi:hypothetical protein
MQVGLGCPRVMDDTVAMQDTNGPTLLALQNSNKLGQSQPNMPPGVNSNGMAMAYAELGMQQQQQSARASLDGGRPPCSPKAPQSPSMTGQQVRRFQEATSVDMQIFSFSRHCVGQSQKSGAPKQPTWHPVYICMRCNT